MAKVAGFVSSPASAAVQLLGLTYVVSSAAGQLLGKTGWSAGKLLRIALAWFQEQVGVSYPILAQVNTDLPHLESKWLTSLRQFLMDNTMSLQVDVAELPKLQRMYDVHLMDMILNANKFKAAEIRRLNYCQLYL